MTMVTTDTTIFAMAVDTTTIAMMTMMTITTNTTTVTVMGGMMTQTMPRIPAPLLSRRAPAARYPTAVQELPGTTTKRAGSVADKVSCVLKHLRRIRDDGVRRRQARR